MNSDLEKARNSVYKNIENQRKKFKQNSDELYQHFKNYLKTGDVIYYAPPKNTQFKVIL